MASFENQSPRAVPASTYQPGFRRQQVDLPLDRRNFKEPVVIFVLANVATIQTQEGDPTGGRMLGLGCIALLLLTSPWPSPKSGAG